MSSHQPAAPSADIAALLGAHLKAQAKKPAKKTVVKNQLQQWAYSERTRLTQLSAALSLGPAGDILSTADDGWKTAIVLGMAGTAAAGAWGWTPGVWKWRRQLPAMNDRIIALSAPMTGSALLATMASAGGPEWGENPWWGFSLVWSLGYGTWMWRRGSKIANTAPELTQQMLDWMTYGAAPDGPYPKAELTEPTALRNGWTADIKVPRGKTFQPKIEELASALNVSDLTLLALEKINPRTGRVTVMRHNPLQKGSKFGDQHTLNPETGLAPIGSYYDGEPAHYRFFLPGSGAVHSFVTGTSGSGKSRLLDALLGIERRSPLVASIVIDPQNGLSLPDWPEGVALFAPGVDFGIVVLRAVKALMDERANRYNAMQWLDEKGRTRTGRAFFVPGEPDPLISVTLDEAHKLLKHEEYGAEAAQLIGDLAKEARKVGIKFRLANQSPNASELGGETLIRDILQGGNNAVLRSGSRASGLRAAGTALDGIDPGAIQKEFADGSSTAGMGYLAGPDNRAAMWRAPYVEDPYGLAHEGTTTPIEQASIDALPILRHALEEHELMNRLRQEGKRYIYDPERFTARPAAAKVSTRKTPAPAAISPTAAPAGTTEKIVQFLAELGTPTAPAIIANRLGLTRPQVRTALKRMKETPGSQVITIGHGVWVHVDHADDYEAAA